MIKNQDALGTVHLSMSREIVWIRKGPKCFKCNAFGHIAAKCNTLGKSIVKKDGEVNAVDLVEQIATNDEIIVKLNGMQIRAMIDTGTRQTLLRQAEYEKLNNLTLQPSASKIQGFGSASVNAIGTFQIEMTIHGKKYVTQVYVVPNSAMSHAMLL